MWPFNNQHKNIEELNSVKHSWVLLESRGDEGPLLIRLNETAKEWAKHPKLCIRVGFAIPLKLQESDGIPSPDESEELNEIEDGITKLIAETGPSIQVLAVTAGAFKEYVFYIENVSAIEQVHKQAIISYPKYDIQCYGEKDPTWLGYYQWQKS